MMLEDNDKLLLKSACHDIYRKCVDGILSQEDTDFLEDTFMQTTGIYKKQDTSKPFNQTSSGRNVEKLQNIIRNLCDGEYPANKEIKNFLKTNGYIKEDNGIIEFTPSFTLQTPDNGLIGGCTKTDKEGNILIIINEEQAKRSDNSLAVVLGHEICHQMIREKSQNFIACAEVEALCDVVGLVAAKGAGYDVKNKIAEDEKDYSRDTQKKVYEQFYPNSSLEEIEEKVDNHMKNIVDAFYIPKKMKTIAEFIDKKIPISNKRTKESKVNEVTNRVRKKLFQKKVKEDINRVREKISHTRLTPPKRKQTQHIDNTKSNQDYLKYQKLLALKNPKNKP